MKAKFFDSIVMLRFCKKKLAKKMTLWGENPINIWDVDIDIAVIPKLVETNNNSEYLIGYLGEVMKRFVLILLKIRIYVETFKDTNNKLIPFL